MPDSFIPDSFVADKPAKVATPTAPKAPPTYGEAFRHNLARFIPSYLNPRTPSEHLQTLALTTLLTGGAGTLAEAAGLPAWLGRVAMQGGLGAGEAAAAGGGAGRITGQGAVDAALAGLTEAVMGKLAKPGQKALTAFEALRSQDAKAVAKAMERYEKDAAKALRRATQFGQAKEDIPKGIEAAADVIRGVPGVSGQTRLTIPTLGGQTPLRLTEIGERLGQLRGREYAAALDEITSALEAKAPGAGAAFRQRVSGYLVEPTPFTATRPTMPERTPPGPRVPLAASGLSRAAVESGLTQPLMGIPAATFALPFAGQAAGPARRLLPMVAE